MKNFIQDGAALDLTAPRSLTSGEGFVVGAIFAVAAAAAANGAPVIGATEGVFELTKKTATVFSAGDLVSWDNTNHRCDAPGSSLYPIGVATAPAGNGAATVLVKLNEVATVAAA
ncbi:MAG: capsid cement protein [Rhodospirillaceae bacterium]